MLCCKSDLRVKYCNRMNTLGALSGYALVVLDPDNCRDLWAKASIRGAGDRYSYTITHFYWRPVFGRIMFA